MPLKSESRIRGIEQGATIALEGYLVSAEILQCFTLTVSTRTMDHERTRTVGDRESPDQHTWN